MAERDAQSSTSPVKLDLVVVGAGWFGLAAAKTYHELHPHDNILVLDQAGSVGGVWAQGRIYPLLRTNNLLGTYEYPDFPMSKTAYDVRRGEHIPGSVVHQYLTDYAKNFDIFDRIRFDTKVETIESGVDGWVLTCQSPSRPRVRASRLIMATGLTSRPRLPSLPKYKSFGAPIFHVKDFHRYAKTLESDVDATYGVVVIGGAKSAWDVSYAYAAAGAQVHMVMRPSGHGPVWTAPPYVTYLRLWLELLVVTRLLTWFNPSIWGDQDGYGMIQGWLHETKIGRFLVNAFWRFLEWDLVRLNEYDSCEDTKKLRPWTNAFRTSTSVGILNYPTSFFEMVKQKKIQIHVADVDSLGLRRVHLSNGKILDVRVLVCATGWEEKPDVRFVDTSEGTAGNVFDPLHTVGHFELAAADREILRRFPRLQGQPKTSAEGHARQEKSDTGESGQLTTNTVGESNPFRLYRFIVPPPLVVKSDDGDSIEHEHNIAFAGMLSTIATSTCASIQALWICAYFANKLEPARLPCSQGEVNWQTALHTQFGKWRLPSGYGSRFPDLLFDSVPYLDMLLRDMGLEHRRKSNSIAGLNRKDTRTGTLRATVRQVVGSLKEVLQPYGVADYRGLVEEWKAKHGLVHDGEHGTTPIGQ